VLGDIRRRFLPQIEEKGVLSNLPIPPTSGLAEAIHVVFFPNNIVGSEFNFYGPRISRLSRYLSEKSSDIAPVPRFESLLRRNISDKLDRLEDVRLFQLKIRRSFIDVVKDADEDLGAAFEAAARAGDAEDVEIVLKARAYSRAPIAKRLMTTIKRLVESEQLREEAERFVVRGRNEATERVEMIDVLSDKLISSQQIVLQNERTRTLNSTSAYAAIGRAYNELRRELEAAAGIDTELWIAE
jgi:hypothetical protein